MSAPYRPARRWAVFTTSFFAVLLPMLLWALASPMMSVPDEASHAIRAAAVADGQFASIPWNEDTSLARVEVPRYVAHGHELSCFKFRPDISAACQQPIDDDPNEIVTAGTSAGLNSPVYYAIVGLPTRVTDGAAALYGMRGVSAVLAAGMLAVMIMQVLQLARSRFTMIASAVAVTPMVLYLGGAINPNGVEVAAAGALFATLVLTVRTTAISHLLWERAALVVISVTLLLSTRSISLLWVLVILGASLIFADRTVLTALVRRPAAWVAVALSGLMSVLTVGWYLGLATFSEHPTDNVGSSPVIEFFTMLLTTIDYSEGLIGFFGWTDTPSPSYSVVVYSFGIVTVLVAALVWGSRRGKVAVAGFTAVLVLVPAVTQAVLISSLGSIWQGRYMLAIFLCLLVACGLALDDAYAPHDERTNLARMTPFGLPNFVLTALVLLALGQVASFVSVLRRYMVTVNGEMEAMFSDPPWQPPLGFVLLTALLLAALAVLVILTYRAAFVITPNAIDRNSRTDTLRPADGSAAAGSNAAGKPTGVDLGGVEPHGLR